MDERLSFGIPDLDEMLGGGLTFTAKEGTSLCLVGPDGAGKSVLALHMAARYKARKPTRRVVYFSVDLNHQRAELTWNNYGLNRLAERDELLYAPEYENDPDRQFRADTDPYKGVGFPLEKVESMERLCAPPDPKKPASVQFFDVRSSQSGDVWQGLSRLTALLRAGCGEDLPLLIVDSVDSLMAIAGPVDIFGDADTRQGRISRILDIAKDTCHVCLVVAASGQYDRPDEAYLTDAVIRLRVTDDREYSVRSVEVEKARGQEHVRGKHQFVIRSGAGSTTGRMQNPDDRRMVPEGALDPKGKPIGYLRIFHSLDYLDSRSRRLDDPERFRANQESERFTNLVFLDDLVGDKGRIRQGSVNAIVGDGKTHKSNIGRAFLREAVLPSDPDSVPAVGDPGTGLFEPMLNINGQALVLEDGKWPEPFRHLIRRLSAEQLQGLLDAHQAYEDANAEYRRRSQHASTPGDPVSDDRKRRYAELRKLLQDLDREVFKEKRGIAILLTTDDTRPEELARNILTWANFSEPKKKEDEREADRKEREADLSAAEADRVARRRDHEESKADREASEADRIANEAAYRERETARRESEARRRRREAERRKREAARKEREAARKARTLLEEWVESRIICRRFETHIVYPSTFVGIVRSCIQEARRILDIHRRYPAEERRQRSGRIRLVIDDWNTIEAMYGALREDSRCLQFLMRDLRELGVSSLIVSSEPAIGSQLGSEGRRSLLLNEAENVLLTWPVLSRGRRIVAICSGESRLASDPTIIRQVRREDYDSERVLIDPVLELYRGLLRAEAEPTPIPLRVFLLDAEHAGADYVRITRKLFDELFSPVSGHDHVIDLMGGDLSLPERYEFARALAYFKVLPLDHTLVVLADEFWGSGTHESFWDLGEGFLFEDVDGSEISEHEKKLKDPHELYRRWTPDHTRLNRWKFFCHALFPDVPVEAPKDDPAKRRNVWGVPYSWDFGFMALRWRAWSNARNRELEQRYAGLYAVGKDAINVGDVWDAFQVYGIQNEQERIGQLKAAADKGKTTTDGAEKASVRDPISLIPAGQTIEHYQRMHCRAGGDVEPPQYAELRSWRWFLAAAQKVAQSEDHFVDERISALGLSSAGPETLSQLVLEVWFSEIRRSIDRVSKDGKKPIAGKTAARSAIEEKFKKLFVAATDPAEAPSLRELVMPLVEGAARGGSTGRQRPELEGLFDACRAKGEPHTDVLEKQEHWRADESRAQRDAALLTLYNSGFALELYKAMRMLVDFLYDSGVIDQLDRTPEPVLCPSERAVAIKHLYKTAAGVQAVGSASDPYVPVRMPGYCTTRGDMYLAISRGSRSLRLGQWSIDKLVSVRGNVSRLHEGVGLPVRHIGSDTLKDLRTAIRLTRFQEQVEGFDNQYYPPQYSRQMTYEELLRQLAPQVPIAETPDDPLRKNLKDAEFQFLFRSRIRHYAAHTSVWRRWIRLVFCEMAALRRSRGTVWISGLEVYDKAEAWQQRVLLEEGPAAGEGVDPSDLAASTIWKEFGKWSDSLVRQLDLAYRDTVR